MHQGEDISEDMWKEKGKPRRIDHYWRDILKLEASSGKCKYTSLAKVVKGVLALPHGNAMLKEGFQTISKC